MSFREKMGQMRREYRKEADRLDKKIDHLTDRVDQGFGTIQERLGRVELQLQATRDEVAATSEAVGMVRGDLQETTRTMRGRNRLMEDHFGKMLELVENAVDSSTIDRIERIEARLEALEAKDDPAA